MFRAAKEMKLLSSIIKYVAMQSIPVIIKHEPILNNSIPAKQSGDQGQAGAYWV